MTKVPSTSLEVETKSGHANSINRSGLAGYPADIESIGSIKSKSALHLWNWRSNDCRIDYYEEGTETRPQVTYEEITLSWKLSVSGTFERKRIWILLTFSIKLFIYEQHGIYGDKPFDNGVPQFSTSTDKLPLEQQMPAGLCVEDGIWPSITIASQLQRRI